MRQYSVVAIDGPVGSGKSTVARRLADRLGYILLDTGAIYRALALRAREEGVGWDDEPALAGLAQRLRIEFSRVADDNRVLVDDRDVSAAIRTSEISEGASRVSRWPAVRRVLLDVQRGFAERGPVVAEGRDMATVVFPDAPVKVYLDADPAIRARRRHEELQAAGEAATLEDVLRAARQRDAADTQRESAPLLAAEGAVRLDTTQLSVDEVVDRLAALVERSVEQKRGPT